MIHVILWGLLWVCAIFGAIGFGLVVWVVIVAYLPPRAPFVSFDQHAAAALTVVFDPDGDDFAAWDREVTR